MLMIRYQIVGKKHDHIFRIILTEKRTSPHGKMQEKLGFYNPKTKEVKLEKERILYWIKKGAQTSNSVWNLLVKNEVMKGAKKPILSARYNPAMPKEEEKKKEQTTASEEGTSKESKKGQSKSEEVASPVDAEKMIPAEIPQEKSSETSESAS